MDGQLFEEWGQELYRKFSSEGKSVTLAIDNCHAHARIANLKSIKLFFLAPNTAFGSRRIKIIESKVS